MKQSITEMDLERALRPFRGAPPTAQVRVVQQMIAEWKGNQSGEMPSLAEIGRQLGMRRQVVSEAVRALKKKGILAVRETKEAVVTQRTVKRGTLTIPQPDQFALPFDGGRAAPQLVPA